MEYLRKADIIFINQKTVKRHGGNFVPPDNFLNEAPLDYLIDVISSEMFGEPLYPNISDKAGLYLFNIISNHVFSDGNKRTGLGAALLFLRLNGYQLQDNLISIFEINKNTEYIKQYYRGLGYNDGWIEKRLEIIEHHEKSTDLTSPHANEILLEFVLEVAKAEVSLEECQAWFERNIIKL
jgi:death-on-curing protein